MNYAPVIFAEEFYAYDEETAADEGLQLERDVAETDDDKKDDKDGNVMDDAEMNESSP